MAKEDKRLDRLDALLHALPFDNMPMALSELDGYVTGLLACPEMIPPSEWLPHVWGETGDAQFPDLKTAEKNHRGGDGALQFRGRGHDPVAVV